MAETITERADRLFAGLVLDLARPGDYRSVMIDLEELADGQDSVRAELYQRICTEDEAEGGFLSYRSDKGRTVSHWLWRISGWVPIPGDLIPAQVELLVGGGAGSDTPLICKTVTVREAA